MINGVSNTSQVTQSFQTQQNPQSQHTHKNVQNDKEPQDTVVLSKKATGSGDVDHDGDSH